MTSDLFNSHTSLCSPVFGISFQVILFLIILIILHLPFLCFTIHCEIWHVKPCSLVPLPPENIEGYQQEHDEHQPEVGCPREVARQYKLWCELHRCLLESQWMEESTPKKWDTWRVKPRNQIYIWSTNFGRWPCQWIHLYFCFHRYVSLSIVTHADYPLNASCHLGMLLSNCIETCYIIMLLLCRHYNSGWLILQCSFSQFFTVISITSILNMNLSYLQCIQKVFRALHFFTFCYVAALC